MPRLLPMVYADQKVDENGHNDDRYRYSDRDGKKWLQIQDLVWYAPLVVAIIVALIVAVISLLL